MEEYEQFGIYKYGIELRYPAWWERKVEAEDTYLFFDEYVGSFRITPTRIDRPDFQVEAFLQEIEAKESARNPKWRKIGEKRFLCYAADSTQEAGAVTRIHCYLSGEGNTIITCSFAHDKSMLEDEFTADQVDAALEEVDLILESIEFGNF